MLLLQQIVNGLLIGAVYALFATGLSLTLGVLRIMNMAHGVTISIAAITGVEVAAHFGLPFPLLLIMGGLVGAFVGVVSETIVFGPLRRSRSHDSHSREFSTLLGSLALLTILQSLAQIYTFDYTDDQILRFPTDVFKSRIVSLGGIEVRTISLVMFAVAVVLSGLVWWVMRWTQAGRAARAVAADHEAASMLGIDVTRYAYVIIGSAGALAGVAGILIGIAFNSVDYLIGSAYLLRGFAVLILGGIGSVPGALVGGLTLGLAEGLTVHFIDSSWVDAVAFGLLFVVLVVRPQGMFGKLEVDRA